MNPKIPFIVGPTASGKTAVSLIVARALAAHIISADSRQLYQHMEIGTAQPTAKERAQVPHHFVGCLKPTDSFSAGEYCRQARTKIAELRGQSIIALVVGGSGLYISALADDFFRGPAADQAIRDRIKAVTQEEGMAKLYEELQKIDPLAAEKILPGDYRRIERALEIYHLTGIPISQLRRQNANPPPYSPVLVGLQWPRQQLYARINARCMQMLERGLIAEVEHLRNLGLTSSTCNALDSVGYVEVLQYLEGRADYNEMVRLFQRNTRRFAKRQISWFKRDSRLFWVNVDLWTPMENIAEQVLGIFRREGIEAN